MVKRFVLVIIAFLLWLPIASPVFASSEQAYRDYQFQYDVYRQRSSDYHIAYTQYQQFKSLASQQEALEKAKLFLAQRDNVAKTYYLFLSERITENPGMLPSEVSLYRSIITNQIGYLDQNVVLAPSIASFEDAKRVSEDFLKNYETLQAGYRQSIAAIELGYLQYFAKRFDETAKRAQALIIESKSQSTPQKQAVLDRWLLSLSNKYTLFQQKATDIRASIPKITGDVQQQDRLFLALQIKIGAARQDLVEAASYLKEVETALKYE